MDRSLLEKRLQILNAEIGKKQRSRTLLAALLGEGSLRPWHQLTDKLAPDAHLDWLQQQGFKEKEALHLKWLSKNMNEHDQYMTDFMTVFQTLERWGPSSDADTQKALDLLPIEPKNIVDIGCGKGFSTRLLAKQTNANIVAVDNEQSALDELGERLAQQQPNAKVTLTCASMTELPFSPSSFDVVWSEGSAYIMGVEQALKQWRSLLVPEGYMVVSDLVWLTENQTPAAKEFWLREYPDMQMVATRLQQIEQGGFELIAHFPFSKQARQDYYQPLKARIAELKPTMENSPAIADIEQEIAIYENYLGEFGYQMFVLKKGD
jgi:cyclopropane fatty-acyl-phospholipid synthase-like methyltransferase